MRLLPPAVSMDAPDCISGGVCGLARLPSPHVPVPRGETIATADAAALCRCGATGNYPFCDGSHTRTGFVKP